MRAGSAFARSASLAHEPWSAAGASVVADGGAGSGGGGARGEEGGAASRAKTEEELEAERAAELAALERRLAGALSAREAATRERALVDASKRGKGASLRDAREAGAELEREFTLQKRALEMLPEAERHVRELEEGVTASESRLRTLVDEWEEHRGPLVRGIRAAKDTGREALDRRESTLQAAAALRAELPVLAEEVRAREGAARAAQAQLGELKGGTASRVDYTRRILGRVASVRRQQAEIDRVVGDIRTVQEAISHAVAKLGRAVKEADDAMVPKGAAGGTGAKPAQVASYRMLTQLREMFNGLVQSVDDTADADGLVRRLEAQTEELETRAAARNKESVLRDLKAMRGENEALEAKIAAIK